MLSFFADIFSSFLGLLLLAALVFAFVLYWFILRPLSQEKLRQNHKRKRKAAPIQETLPPPKKEKPEERLQVKEEQKRPTLEKIENKRFRDKIEKERDPIKIVGIVEPIGMWTRMIIQQKLDYLMARLRMGENKSEGYWVNLIKAQETSKKEKGKGR